MTIQMNDIKNSTLAAIGSIPTYLTAIETQTMITIASSIILPICLFFAGKVVDILYQEWRVRRIEQKRLKEKNNG